MLNLDTHVLIYALTDELTLKERHVLEREEWGVSGIVCWELTKLGQRSRISVDLKDSKVVAVLSRIHVFPVDWRVSSRIVDLDFKSDPADEIIAATSLAFDIPLMTRDRKILASKVVPLAIRAR